MTELTREHDLFLMSILQRLLRGNTNVFDCRTIVEYTTDLTNAEQELCIEIYLNISSVVRMVKSSHTKNEWQHIKPALKEIAIIGHTSHFRRAAKSNYPAQ